VQALERGPEFLQVSGVYLGEGLPVPGDACHQLTAERAGHADRLVEIAQQRPGPVEQRLASQGELHPVRGTSQQVASDEPLQIANLPAQRGLGQVEPGRGPAEVQLVSHRYEGPQVPQLDRVGCLRQSHDLCAVAVVAHVTDYRWY